MELLNELHPNYTRDVMEFISRGYLLLSKLASECAFWRKQIFQKILLVFSSYGGGTTYHLEELSNFYKGRACFFIFKT